MVIRWSGAARWKVKGQRSCSAYLADRSRTIVRYFLVCVYAVLDCSVCLWIIFLCCCFCYWCSAVVKCTFLFLPQLHFVHVQCLQKSSFFVSVSYFFAVCAGLHLLELLPLCMSMSTFPSSRRSCKAS